MGRDSKPRLPRTEEVQLLGSEQRTVEQLAGTVLLDRYRLLEPLGSGGASVVYRAEHTIMHKPMAVKILRPEHAVRPDFVRRFLDEARTVSRLRHENIVDVVDIGRSESGVVFCVMEWLEGEDLGATIDRDGPMPWPRAQRIVLQVCRALIAAHAAGIVHRDVKPQNCFRIRRGRDRDFIKLLDFGIAKDIGATHRLTVTGAIIGTAGYMAPEQARGESVDVRADVYAVGAVLFELLSGRPVFDGEHFLEVMVMQATEPAPRLASVVADLPPDLDDVVARALARSRDDRFSSMEELASAIMAIGRSAPPRVAVVADDAKTVVAPAPAPPATAVTPRPLPYVESWPPPIAPATADAGASRPPVPSGSHPLPNRPHSGAAVVLLLALILPAAIALGVYVLRSTGAEEDAAPVSDPAPAATSSAEPVPLAVDEPRGQPRIHLTTQPPTPLPAPPDDAGDGAPHDPPTPTVEADAVTPNDAATTPPPSTPELDPPNRGDRRVKRPGPASQPRRETSVKDARRRETQRIEQLLQRACGDKHAREPYEVTLQALPGEAPWVYVTPSSAPLKDCIARQLGGLHVQESMMAYRIRLKPKASR